MLTTQDFCLFQTTVTTNIKQSERQMYLCSVGSSTMFGPGFLLLNYLINNSQSLSVKTIEKQLYSMHTYLWAYETI